MFRSIIPREEVFFDNFEKICTLLLSTVGGIPVSTTHTITGAIIRAGATTKLSTVRWGAANIVFAWLLTIPTTAVISGVLYSIFITVRGT